MFLPDAVHGLKGWGPLQVLPFSSIAGAQGATALPFRTFIPAPTDATDSSTLDVYAEVLARMWFFMSQLALGNDVCSSG